LTIVKDSQVCVLTKAKNLTEPQVIKELAGEEKGTLLDYAWRMKKRGLADNTIKLRTYLLKQLQMKGAVLENPDSIETILATERLTPSHKSQLVAAYRSYTKTMNITWTPIKVRYESKQVFLPTEEELNELIAGSGRRTSAFLQTLKDTAGRVGEICKLKWTDLNEANNTIRINDPEKGSKSRTVKVSPKTLAMLNGLSKKYGEYIFNPKPQSIKDVFGSIRNRLAQTLQNPRLKQIHLHTFRHWKATMEYHKTKDILYVMKLLGHKNIQNTLIYTQLANFDSEEYHSATATTIDEAKQLIDAGFEYVCDMESVKLFRKRK
jgi:integrase